MAPPSIEQGTVIRSYHGEIYEASAENYVWSDEDQSLIVEVPELPGCMADGESYEVAVANAKRAIEEWIETARELGRPMPEPKGRLSQ